MNNYRLNSNGYFISILTCVFCLIGCQAQLGMSPTAVNQEQEKSPLSPLLQLNGQVFSLTGLTDKLKQKAGGKGNRFQPPPNYPYQRHPELLITDVLTDNISVFGGNAPAALVPDYAGTQIALVIKGTFERRNDKPLKLKSFLFTLEPPLVQQTLIGQNPISRVVLDDMIPLQTTAVSRNEIRATLNTQGLPDLYLKGLHKITLEHDQYYTDALIRVGDPVPTDNLLPQVTGVEIMRNNQGKAEHIRLSGKHFMVYPKLSYATIDGEFGFGYQTEVSDDGTAETVVHVPDPATFDSKPTHTVIYATPFGVTFKEF